MGALARKFEAALTAAGALGPAPGETLALDLAHGRVTGGPVWAQSSSPHYDAAAMDGVAVRSLETVGATETSPVRLAVDEQAVWVDTGDAMPDGFDAVIKVEVVHEIDDATIEIRASVPPYHDVRPLGEDIAAAELVVPAGHTLRPQDLAACAQAGLSEIDVRRAPRVAVIPTGSELVPVGTAPEPGGIIESNSLMLAAMISEWGGEAARHEPVPDNLEQLRVAVAAAVEGGDVVIVNAGSSAGSEDYTAQVIRELGSLVVHGVAVKPGHPVALGVVGNTPVLGIPGYAVSAALTTELFVKPVIERKLGLSPRRRESIRAVMTRKTPSSMGEDEYLRVRLGRVGDRLVATPIQRGAGIIMSLVRADGLAVSPRGSEGFDAGVEVDVELLRSPAELEATIVATGSHDMALDLLASELHRLRPDRSLASANVGSLGGLLALSRGEAHLAGCHLLDEETQGTGADGEAGQSQVHSLARRPCPPRRCVREPAARLRHANAGRPHAEGRRDTTRQHPRLRARGVYSPCRRGRRGWRTGRRGRRRTLSGPSDAARLRGAWRRAVRPRHPCRVLRERPARPAAGPHTQQRLPAADRRPGRLRHRQDRRGAGGAMSEHPMTSHDETSPERADSVSAVVLAGGLSRRLGRDKAVEPLIRRVLSRVAQVTDQTVVVVNDAARASELPLGKDVVAAVDRYPGAGSLGGIFTGLEASRSGWALVVACDMPFLNVPLLRRILSLRSGCNAVVPVIDGRPEPTHAAYSKRCLPHIERRLQANDLKISRFFENVEVEYLPQSTVDEYDPDHLSFFNVNTEQDLERARRIAGEKR